MPDEPVLRLELLDAFGERIQEEALLRFRSLTLGETLHARSPAGKAVSIKGLRGGPNGLYRVEADPAAYLMSARFIDIKASGRTDAEMHFAIDPRKVTRVNFPEFADLSADAHRMLETGHVPGFDGTGRALYDALDDVRRAGFLNIVAKCAATTLLNARTVSSYLQELRDLRGDRFFCRVPQELRDEVKNAAQSGLFESVSGSLHHPPDGFDPAGSFKTPDLYGNLQLTFFASATEWVADVDIDDANGLGHVFQVLRNELTGRPTHPFDIQQILARHQRLDAGYRLEIA